MEEYMGRTISIITARGGSKRIPRKNIKEFCGKPIIAYSIEAAIESNIFDEVMVSTDDDEIKEIALQYGAKVPFMRSKENSNDFASTVDVILEVLENYGLEEKKFEKACCIYPTAPFVTAEKLIQAMQLLDEGDSVMPVVKYSFPPLRSVILEQGKVRPMWEQHMSSRSQDLPELYHDCGQFYCFWVNSFIKQKTLITENTVPMIIPEIEVQDIDNPDDWEIAQIKFKYMSEKNIEIRDE